MAKANKNEILKVIDYTVTLELSQEEARTLQTVLWHIGGGAHTKRSVCCDIMEVLENLGVSPLDNYEEFTSGNIDFER